MITAAIEPLVWTTSIRSGVALLDTLWFVHTSGALQRDWQPDWSCDVSGVLGPLRKGPADPTFRVASAGDRWLGMRTPQGPATLQITVVSGAGLVRGTAWGDGASWALDGLPGLLGAADDSSAFVAHHPLVVEAWRRFPHVRIGRTLRVFDALVPAVIEQKVTGQEAYAGYRALVRRFGTRAPGPQGMPDLWIPPEPEVVRRIPSWDWLAMHIDPARSRTLVAVARVADSLERLSVAGLMGDEADGRLRSVPGVGEWTSAEVRARALGDADAVSFGDYHLAKEIGWALFGHDIDDDELRTVLEPYRPQRGRAVQLIALSGSRRPRRGPRMAPRTHLPAP
jgi:3-methyladenine DNA glycosylase/8-oxoguanine DNA glycosylase